MNDENKNVQIKVPVTAILSILAVIISLYSIVQVRALKDLMNTLSMNDVQNEEEYVMEVEGENLLNYPYYQTTQTVNGITTTDNGDGSLTITGKAQKSAVVFRIESNSKTLKIPLNNKKYVFKQGIDRSIFSGNCRIDIGLMKKDGSTIVLNGDKGNGDVFIDNSSGIYQGIYAISLYSLRDFSAPSNYTFVPSLTLSE